MFTLSTPLIPLLGVVFTSILEVFLLCLAGYVLAVRGVLDKRTQKQLNRLNVTLFTPSLLFSKVAFFLTPARLRELYVIPILFVVVTLTSMCVAFFLAALFRLRPSQRSFAVAAAMFMNSNSLPIALMQSLVITVPGLKWEEEDNKNAMLGRALTYLVLYSTFGMVLRWSYGVRLLARADSIQVPEASERSPLLSHEPSPDIHLLSSGPTPPKLKRTNVFYTFPNTPNASHIDLPSCASSSRYHAAPPPAVITPSDTEVESDADSEPETRYTLRPPSRFSSPPPPPPPISRSLLTQTTVVLSAINRFMTAPLYAAALSLIVALTPPLQHALDHHLTPIKSTLSAAGGCAIPLTLVVLGAYFYHPPAREEREARRGRVGVDDDDTWNEVLAEDVHRAEPRRVSSFMSLKNLRDVFRRDRRNGVVTKSSSRPGETKTVVISIVARMILTPLVLLPLMALSKSWDVQAVFDDPVFVVSTVLLISSPPALTLAQITQAASGDAFERLISRTIFWAYCVVTPPATMVFVVLGLMLTRL